MNLTKTLPEACIYHVSEVFLADSIRLAPIGYYPSKSTPGR